MGLFRRKKLSKAPVDQWDSDAVQAWAKRIAGLPKTCRRALKPMTGQELVRMTPRDVDAMLEKTSKPISKKVVVAHLELLKGQSSCKLEMEPLTCELTGDESLSETSQDVQVYNGVTNVLQASQLPAATAANEVLQPPAPSHSLVLQAEQPMPSAYIPARIEEPPAVPLEQHAAPYATATIDTTPPQSLRGSDRANDSKPLTTYEGENLPVTFDPNPPRQDLSQAIAEFQMGTDEHSEMADENICAPVHGHKGYASASGVLEPLHAMASDEQLSLEHILPEMEPSSIKPSSMQTCDTVSAHSSKLDTLSVERRQLRADLGDETEQRLMEHFLAFANFSNHGELLLDMDGVHFAKYCADTRIIGGGVTRTDVDLAFAGAKMKGTRRIAFEQFLKALRTLGDRRGISLADMAIVCLLNEGPINHSADKVSNVRLHDDKTTYTGVYKRGGPDTMDGGAKSLHQITNRRPANYRGVQLTRAERPDAQGPRRIVSDTSARVKSMGGMSGLLTPSSMAGLPNAMSMPEPSSSRRLGGASNGTHVSERVSTANGHHIQGWEEMDRLEQIFASFAVFGKGSRGANVAPEDIRMDSKAFAKLMKDAGVMYGKLNLTRVDLCFTKCCDKVGKRMSFEQFLNGLAECAAARGDDLLLFKETVANCQPMVHATVARPVKWHDDRSMYTGVYAQGGPTNVDRKISFKDIVNRDARPTSGRRGSVASWAS
eukprot:jgi/Ulvmu1/7379/UM036_0039.1